MGYDLNQMKSWAGKAPWHGNYSYSSVQKSVYKARKKNRGWDMLKKSRL